MKSNSSTLHKPQIKYHQESVSLHKPQIKHYQEGISLETKDNEPFQAKVVADDIIVAINPSYPVSDYDSELIFDQSNSTFKGVPLQSKNWYVFYGAAGLAKEKGNIFLTCKNGLLKKLPKEHITMKLNKDIKMI